ncbi:MAG: hypothetical protein QXJ07_05570, partial [Candidatus Bathyarchaeia archaeon]
MAFNTLMEALTMPYNFVYDLTKVPVKLFKELVSFAYQQQLHRRVAEHARSIVKAFKLEEATGLNISDAVTLIEDLIEVQTANILYRD